MFIRPYDTPVWPQEKTQKKYSSLAMSPFGRIGMCLTIHRRPVECTVLHHNYPPVDEIATLKAIASGQFYQNQLKPPSSSSPGLSYMPSGRRETSPRSGTPEQCGTDAGTTPALDDWDRDRFCEEYHLGDEIRELLESHGFDIADSLLDTGDTALEELGFKVGHIAELNWALKKMMLRRFPTMSLTVNTQGKYKPVISGGTGGAGGDSRSRPGRGGIGMAPRFSIEDVGLFSVISGGTGGAGGANGVMQPSVVEESPETKSQSKSATREAEKDLGSELAGGTGGPGGHGHQLGGLGGVGEAAQMAAEHVPIFRAITGGFGGAGGTSPIQGGSGGTGEGSEFSHLLFPIDDETRRRVPYTKLEDFSIKADLCQFLKDGGFQTVGGLFEAYDKDLELLPHFKAGYVATLRWTLRKFAARARRLEEWLK
ncbi:hypothetical protein MVEN_00763200 [Mycena venus]|uniref:Uncharacterized protein n=1 Tax=Mycena venus TaxID=2733690 RepID=A0A8H6YKN6_9AGAR|nr:hypothetical protein MVEN_00763200 [Mycena venus]